MLAGQREFRPPIHRYKLSTARLDGVSRSEDSSLTVQIAALRAGLCGRTRRLLRSRACRASRGAVHSELEPIPQPVGGSIRQTRAHRGSESGRLQMLGAGPLLQRQPLCAAKESRPHWPNPSLTLGPQPASRSSWKIVAITNPTCADPCDGRCLRCRSGGCRCRTAHGQRTETIRAPPLDTGAMRRSSPRYS
jgi:hypothetical protein